MKDKNLPLYGSLMLLIGELCVSAVVVGVYLMIERFSYKVVTGLALGCAVTVLNYFFMALSTMRAFDKAIEARGDGEMDDEAAAKFAEEQKVSVNNAVKVSFLVRTVTMVATLVVAFVVEQFDVIATLIPLLMLRPIITVEALIRERRERKKS